MDRYAQKLIPTVLVVDDNPKNVQIIALLLRDLKYKIIIAVNGKSAIDLVERARPDIILMDVMMPGMDGFEACQIIKTKPENENIPVIFLTALSEKVNIVKGFDAGGVDYITKPFNKEELISRIKTHLELKFTRDEMQQMTNHLVELNSIKDKMFSVIGHDLRSPLGSIKMTLDFLKSDTAQQYKIEDFRNSVNLLAQTTDEVFGLLENLLGWAKSQSGNLSVVPENVQVSELVNSVYLLHKGNFNHKSITFENNVDKESVVYTDMNMLKAILRNLISNAIKYTPEGGTITIHSKELNDFTHIIVTDNGVGISFEDIPKLFDEKQHLTTYGTNKESGSGLGLILSQSFVKSNNGRLMVESEQGKGSSFIIELPSAKSHG
jgi:two-component system, sensor histidine kinase and response regulator